MLRAEGDSCTAQGEVLLSCHTWSQTILPVSAASTSARGRVVAGGLQRKPASSRPLQRLFPENTEVKALLRLGGEKTKYNKGRFQDLIWDSAALSHVVFTTAEILPGC